VTANTSDWQCEVNELIAKQILAVVAVILTFIGFYPYIRSIFVGTVKPHVFSWIIWGSVTIFVFVAQLYDGGGAGAWPMGVTGVISILVAVIAFYKTPAIRGDQLDWFFLLLALSSLPLWYFTSNPLWAVGILTAAEVLGFVPTIRKACLRPYEESLLFFAIFAARNTVSILALENYTLTTLLFPVTTAFACVILIVVVMNRRTVANRNSL